MCVYVFLIYLSLKISPLWQLLSVCLSFLKFSLCFLVPIHVPWARITGHTWFWFCQCRPFQSLELTGGTGFFCRTVYGPISPPSSTSFSLAKYRDWRLVRTIHHRDGEIQSTCIVLVIWYWKGVGHLYELDSFFFGNIITLNYRRFSMYSKHHF